ncbi:LacI family DNA-binding transcriptional regulator [Streptosporangium sp. NBC_01756]|uniref:LacI family DNA-binding transcriptional regulator n=1 Tax=Streptosporangium sp. NBC_01756 TaxID=2975950 RepID=UPI002DDBC8B5|nr:LacI family DNA-binding transcriptional regulator [Streptosporangium sp. NBC_01756]WSC86248.1 LacI family transcriptional regulator [Streptosporangium sp. NBC_01756]
MAAWPLTGVTEDSGTMTIEDLPTSLPKLAVIAREVGVSVATVSKTLNGRPGVSAHTRRLIVEVLERHGYPRHRLKPAKGSVVDVVLQGLSSAYALAILEGMEDAAWRLGVDLVVSTVVGRTKNGQPPPAWLDRISARDSAGVLLVRTLPTAVQRAWLADHGIPAVIVEPPRKPPPGLSVVVSANLAGARAATEHLIGLRHERIAIVTGRPGVPCAAERLAGYRQAMAAAGLPIDPRWELCGYFQMDSALQVTRAMLVDLPEPPTAVFACSDAMALGVYQALAEQGLHVPDDVSVVGFDDSLAAGYATPGLTTVRQPWPELGSAALTALLSDEPPARAEVQTALVVRSSTAPA